MTTKDAAEPLRGEDAYRAAKQEITKRNEAGYARGREVRAARDRAAIQRRVEQEKHERANTPKQPGT